MTDHDLHTDPRSNHAPTSSPAKESQPARPTATRPARLAAGGYFLLAVIGGAGTWYFNLVYAAGNTGGNYLGDWFANPASSSAAVDILVVLLVVGVFYVREGRRLGWRLPLVLLFIVLSALVAVAFAFPLFLGFRELSLSRVDRTR